MYFRVLFVILFFSTIAQSAVTQEAKRSDAITRDGLRNVREIEEEEEDGHGHASEEEGDSHGHASDNECVLDRRGLVKAFNEVALELNLTTTDGHVCSLPIPECLHHDDEDEDHHDDEDEDHHDDEDEEHHDDEDEEGHHDNEEDHDASGSGSHDDEIAEASCQTVFDVCMDLIVHSELSSSSCFSGECLEDENGTSSSSSKPTAAQAYGLGFLMVILVCLGSLLGVFIIPLVRSKDKNENLQLAYKYVYFFMIALGTSALLCDAILHLFPHAWGLHAHEDEEGEGSSDGHAHEEAGGGHGHGDHGVEDFIWKGTIALLAIYLFYLLEYMLHSFEGHAHSHGFPVAVDNDEEGGKKEGVESIHMDVTVPHGKCPADCENVTIVNPSSPTDGENKMLSKENLMKKETESESGKKERKGVLGWLQRVKPLAWLIIIGDGFHNFADGLALGAAVAQSLTLGVSTTIALIFHELPHEFGDYVILLSTGLTWYSALLLNLLSSLTAILGFFIGVAAGTSSEEANNWILAFAAGLFIYIALVDLLPQLIHSKEKGFHRMGLFLAANFGFFLSFLALFLLAVYEEDLNEII